MGWVKTEKTNKLSKLGDIDFTTTAPVDGNALVYDETNDVWVPGEGGGSSGIVELTQAEYDQLTQEEKNNGTIYQISDKGYFYYKEKQFRAIKELTQAQYDLLTPEQKADGTIYMISDATNNLNDLDNVDISNLTDGQIIEYDATTQSWVNATNKIVIQKTQAEYDLLTSAEKNNGSIYKITDKAKIYCLDEAYHAIKEITSINYAQLTNAEKNNGTLYVITDKETTAADIPYSSGVSVGDKLDNVPTFDTLTSSDNNKLLGVSVSGGDISVGAVDTPFKIATFSSSNYSIAANGTQHMAIDFITVPSGYTLAGIVGFATNQASVGVSVMRLTTSGSWALQLFNTSSSALSGQPFEVTVLFIKSSLL